MPMSENLCLAYKYREVYFDSSWPQMGHENFQIDHYGHQIK